LIETIADSINSDGCFIMGACPSDPVLCVEYCYLEKKAKTGNCLRDTGYCCCTYIWEFYVW